MGVTAEGCCWYEEVEDRYDVTWGGDRRGKGRGEREYFEGGQGMRRGCG